MDLDSKKLANLISGMRSTYASGENSMAYARETLKTQGVSGRNQRVATLIAYDLQAGSYVEKARANPNGVKQWCRQLADLIAPVLPVGGSLLEVGVGEATTLSGVLTGLVGGVQAYGFDISWSRIKVANDWLREQSQVAELFVGDLMNIPMADGSIDVVYSSHSLEPNGGQEEKAIAECLRVARHAVVLVEPIYELASIEAQERMRQHGYVRGLREAAQRLGAEVIDYRLLEHTGRRLNPSGVLLIRKRAEEKTDGGSDVQVSDEFWQCPLSGTRLIKTPNGFFAPEVGICYPVLLNIPLLRSEHAIVASLFN